MNRARWIRFACVVLLFFFYACAKKSAVVLKNISEPPVADEIVIVATGDVHAALDRAEGLASVLRRLRRQYRERMVYLDAGDQFQGSLEGNLSKGKSVVEFFNQIKPDAAAIGNHELDFGPDVPGRIHVLAGEDGLGNLKTRVREARYPWLSANFVADPVVPCEPGPGCNALSEKTVFEPRTVIMRGEKRICVIGATTPTTASITRPGFVQGTRFDDLAGVVEAEAVWMRKHESCTSVVLLVHEGLRYEEDGKTLLNYGLRPLLEQLPMNTVDAVIGGHTHIVAEEVIRDTPVLITGKSAKYVGVLHLAGTGTQKKFKFEPILTVPKKAKEPDITAVLKPYRAQADSFKMKPIGRSSGPFPLEKEKESALGNFIADAVQKAGRDIDGAQFSLMNAGGMRNSLPEGRIRYDHIYRVMPFDNCLVIVQLTGSELRRLLEIAFSGSEGIPSVSGLIVRRLDAPVGQPGPWDRDLNQNGQKEAWERNFVIEVLDQNRTPIEDDHIYKLATNDFLAGGGDYQGIVYNQIPKDRIHYYQEISIRDILLDYLIRKSVISPAEYLSVASRRMESAGHSP